MESSDSEHVDQIPAWAEEQFLRDVRSGTADISTLIETIADQLPEIRDSVIAYLKLLAFVECGSTQSAGQTSPLPESIGVYQVDRLIGRGGMGTVVAAHGPDDERVAIKILNPERGPFLERFRREASTIAALSHPGIVKIKGFHDDPALPSLVLEYVDGVSLDALLKPPADGSQETDTTAALLEPAADGAARRLLIAHDFTTIARIGQAVADALAHTHARGIIHRDIKPANIIYGVDGRVCITDFGLARPLKTRDGFTLTGDVIGTPRYMAPEQLRGVADERCDIYSLGVTMWELCTGRSAWESPVESQPHGWKLPPARALKPDVPVELSDLISECCEFEPEERPTASEVSRRLNVIELNSPSAKRVDRRVWKRVALTVLSVAAFCLWLAIAPGVLIDGWSPHSRKAERVVTPGPDLVIETTVRSGQMLIELRDLIPEQSGDGLTAEITGGPDADLLRVDLGSQLCVQADDVLSVRHNRVLEVDLRFSDHPMRSWIAVDDYREPFTSFLISDGRAERKYVVRDTKTLPVSRSIGLASADGRTFFTTLAADTGQIALWEFQVTDSGRITNASCLATDCGLPSGVEALTTTDGETFFACGYQTRTDYSTRKPLTDADRLLWKFQLQSDGTFQMVQERRLPVRTRCLWHLAVMPNGVFRLGWLAGDLPTWGWCSETSAGLTISAFGTRGSELESLASWSPKVPRSSQLMRLRIRPVPYTEYGAVRRSRDDGIPRRITIGNESQASLDILWVSNDGSRVLLNTLAAGASYSQQSFVGHTIEVLHSQELWDRFTVIEEMPTISISGPRDFRERAAW